jgi:ethanolamine permease
MDFGRWALNIGAGDQSASIPIADLQPILATLPAEAQQAVQSVHEAGGDAIKVTLAQLAALPEAVRAKATMSNEILGGNGPMFPFGWWGVLATLPFAVWLFLAIEQLPLAAEESVDPKRDMPKGILLGMVTLIISAFMIVLLNPSVIGVGAHKLGTSGEPLLDGFRAIYGSGAVVLLGIVALTGLIASFHTILFAMGRQVYSLSRAGYFPTVLSITGHTFKTPYVAMIVGALVGLGLMYFVYSYVGEAKIGTTLLNMAVFGAMLSYILQAVSFIILRSSHANIERPYRSPLGVFGALVTIVIAGVTLAFQLYDPAYREAILWVVGWFAVGIVWFALVGRNRLILSPEEEFAMEQKAKAARA